MITGCCNVIYIKKETAHKRLSVLYLIEETHTLITSVKTVPSIQPEPGCQDTETIKTF